MKIKQIKLPLFIIISVIFTFYLIIISSVIVYKSYEKGKNSVDTISSKYIDTTINRITDNLNSFLELPHKINNLNSSLVIQDDLTLKEQKILEHQFVSQIRSFETISSIYLGNIDGGLTLGGREDSKDPIYTINTNNFKAGSFKKHSLDINNNTKELLLSLPNFDARTRPWYITAVKNKRESWSDIYILFTGQDMAIAASRPVFNKKGTLLGVLSIDLFLSKIQNFLQQVDLGKNGEIFIVEKSGLLVASSTEEIPIISDNGSNRRLLANESKEPYIKDIADKLISKFNGLENITKEEVLVFEINEEPVHTHIYPLKDNYGIDWIIAATIPDSDFMKDIWENNKNLIIILVFASIFSAIFSLFASAWIVNPLRKLDSSAKDLVKGDWKHIKEASFIKEMESLNSSFNYMASQLSDTLKELNLEVGERKAAEEAMKESLKNTLEINNKLENYSYTISHDLKEPIRSIRTFSQFISEDYKDKLDDDGKDYLNRIIKASTKMASMIDDLLLLSRIGKQDINFTKTAIKEILEEVTDTLKQSIIEKNIKINASKMPEIFSQSVWIKTVFQNLISNSIKYSDKEEPTIDISYRELSGYHEFSITDNGQGIEPDQQEKIFGLFRKAHQNKNIEGSGAGLAIVKSVIEEHHGKVWVDWSEPGKGTVIKFTIKNHG